MKKPKIKLDADMMKQLALNHIEKVILGIVVLLMLMLVYRGMTLEHLKGNVTPQNLVSNSNNKKSAIDDPQRWKDHFEGERTPAFNLKEQVRQSQAKIDAVVYSLPVSWMRPDFPKLSPRQDPEMYAPQHLIVKTFRGPLASYARLTDVDPLYPQGEELSYKEKFLEQKKKDAAKKKAEKAGNDAGGEMPGGPGGVGGKKTRGKKGASDELTGGMPTRGGRATPMPGGGSEGGMGYGMLGGSAGPLTPGAPYPEASEANNGFISQAPEATIARDVGAVVVMAVVPMQKQIEEYEKKLSQSLDYEPNRDYPSYLLFQVQRADVTDNPAAEADKLAWKSVGDVRNILKDQVYGTDEKNPPLFGGVPVEVVDPNYLEPETLTHYAPPFLSRNLWDALTHPDVPLYSPVTHMESATGTGPGAQQNAGDPDAPTIQGSLGLNMNGGEGGGMGPGGGMGGRPMMGPRMGGGMPGGGMRPGGGMMPGGGMAGGGMGGRPMPGRGSADEGGYGGMGYNAQTYTPPKFKLVRFTDTRVEPNKKYRYRIRVFLQDPNHPDRAYVSPSIASLAPDVQKRVKALDEADSKKPKDPTTGLSPRTFYISSPWSEPSPVAELPNTARIYAGKVQTKAPTKIKLIDVQMSDPVGTALAVVFDKTKVADVGAENDKVSRGSVLNFQQDKLKVIHPVSKAVIELPKYDVFTDALVADLMGGEPIKAVDPKVTTQPLTALGEMLIVDSDGRIHVENEGDDIEYFRRFTVVKEDPAAKKTAKDDDTGLAGEGPGGRPNARRKGSD